MPINWDEEALWADEMVAKAHELGCSVAECDAVAGVLAGFLGAPSRVTRLATLYLEHFTEIGEEVERDKKISEKN